MKSIAVPLLTGKRLGFAGLSLLLMILIPLIDFWEASVHSYSFYLSESLLFGLFWWLFIPGLIFILSQKLLFHHKLSWVSPLVMSVLHLGSFAVIVNLISAIWMAQAYPFWRVLPYAFVEHGLSCLLVYAVAYLFQFYQYRPHKSSPKATAPTLAIPHRNQTILLSLSDILYVAAERPYIAVYTQQRKYLLKRSLKQFMEKEATTDFIQIHKSTLINTRFIHSFRSRKNGDFDIILKNGQELRASRTFRKSYQPILHLPTTSS